MNRDHARLVYYEQIKRVVPLEAVLARYGVLADLKRSGRQLTGRCPIHGSGKNRRQFVVDLTKQVWRCFSPEHDSGGSTLEFVAAMENVDIHEAALLIADWFAIRCEPARSQRRERRKSVSDNNRPTHRVYAAKKRDEGQKDWLTEIGSAWIFSYADDKKTGVNIQLTALPVGDRIVLFENDAEDPHKADTSEKKSNARSKR